MSGGDGAIDPVLRDDAAEEMAPALEAWATARTAELLDELARDRREAAAQSLRSRDTVRPSGATSSKTNKPIDFEEYTPVQQRQWYKFHGQRQAHESAARIIEQTAATLRLRAET